VAVINADDPRVDEFAAHSGAERIVRFGRSAAAAVRIEDAAAAENGLRVRIDGHSAVLPVFGEVNASNAAAAMAMARFCGVSGERALERISRARLSPHRSRTCECGGRTVVDDSYNANPSSVRQALDSLANWPGSHARVAVLADMAELGTSTVALHREVIDHALHRGLDLVIVAGPIFAEAAVIGASDGLVVL
jgi:UDP-N-acetylmuramoyl-tripeptide--D-alanyl-D-alanine ligase